MKSLSFFGLFVSCAPVLYAWACVHIRPIFFRRFKNFAFRYCCCCCANVCSFFIRVSLCSTGFFIVSVECFRYIFSFFFLISHYNKFIMRVYLRINVRATAYAFRTIIFIFFVGYCARAFYATHKNYIIVTYFVLFFFCNSQLLCVSSFSMYMCTTYIVNVFFFANSQSFYSLMYFWLLVLVLI